MTEQERKKAFENQRKFAERREKEADGTLDMERRIRYEKQRRAKQRKEQQMRALKQRLAAMAILIVLVIVAVSLLFRACSKKNKEPQKGAPVQTSQEAAANSIEADNEPGGEAQTQADAPQTVFETAPSETQPETVLQPSEQAQQVASQAADPVAATVNTADAAAQGKVIDPSGIVIPDWITVDLIHINNVSRPAIALDEVHDIAIHYVANPGSSAKANRDYFDSLDNPAVEGAGRQASAHLIVGLEGEVVQCLPLNELAYAVRSRNPDTISIEVCHPDETGKFSDVTYNTLVKLTAWLLQQKGLTPDHVIRHFDCDGKACPLYYVENEDAWNKLKQDIADYYYANPNIQ